MAWSSRTDIMPAVTAARFVAGECDCGIVVAAASKATAANAEIIKPLHGNPIPLATGVSARLAKFNRAMRPFEVVIFSGANERVPLSLLRTWIGVDPRELISGAGGLISRFHVGRQRARIGIGRHCLVNLGLEIGCLFDQERRKLGVFG